MTFAPYGLDYFETLPRTDRKAVMAHNPFRVIDFFALTLEAGESYRLETEGREYCLDLLSGRINAVVDGRVYSGLGGRPNVFAGLPTAIYAGPRAVVELVATERCVLGVGSAKSDRATPGEVIRPEDVRTGQWGERQTTRNFRYLLNGQSRSERLWFAEVIVMDGCWATFPPHKHEDVPGDIFQEEAYFYLVSPGDSFGFCGQFGGQVGGDYAFMIRDWTLHKMPSGYHTVTAAPGTMICYLATYAGWTKDHRPSPHPVHVDHQAFARPVSFQ